MTYTIARRDPATGQVGLTTASYSANLRGNVAAVNRGTAGAALVAAQAFGDPPVGRRAARLVAEGASRDAVLAAVQVDPGAAFRCHPARLPTNRVREGPGIRELNFLGLVAACHTLDCAVKCLVIGLL